MDRRHFITGATAIVGGMLYKIPASHDKEMPHLPKPIKPAVLTKTASQVVAVPTITPSIQQHTKHRAKHWPAFKTRPAGKIKLSTYDRAVLTKTIWGETRGETDLGRMAVVHVILNRIHTDNPLFKSYRKVSQVCLRKYQFSCWLDSWKMRHIKVDDTYRDIKKVVDVAIHKYENGVDYSNGALFYYSDTIDAPKWAKVFKQVNKIGLHNFFA